jgi:hypothetical protein
VIIFWCLLGFAFDAAAFGLLLCCRRRGRVRCRFFGLGLRDVAFGLRFRDERFLVLPELFF